MDIQEIISSYHVPNSCAQCEGTMEYKGVGEYQCENCGYIDYDDYGKVRNYLEKHKGATSSEVETATGVPQRSIRRMLKEGRLEVAEGSKVFLQCEICGVKIKSGRFCTGCEKEYRNNLEEMHRVAKNMGKKGYGRNESGDSGHRRFMRDDR